MKTVIRQSLLAILVAAFGYAAVQLASATTITRPYGSSDYAGGQKAVGSKVNAEFDNIVNWLNGGYISSTNIATGGVATSNLAAASVTASKLAAANIKITASSSAYSMNSVTPATVTSLSTTITTNGRPVRVELENAPATYISGGTTYYGGFVDGSANTGLGPADGHNLFFVSDGATTAFFKLKDDATVANGFLNAKPCSSFSYTEQPSAGSHTYEVKASVQVSGGSNAVLVHNCRLVVREL